MDDSNQKILLDALDTGEDDLRLTLDGHPIHLSHLSKVLWPAQGTSYAVTKRDLIRYYAQVAPTILPHLQGRPISFVRYPDGVGGQGFFQKHPIPGTPNYVGRVKIWSEHSHKGLDWVMCNDLATLIWLAQMDTVEIHPWYSRIDPEPGAGKPGVEFDTATGLDASVLNYPDYMVFDLDPNIEGSAKELGSSRAFDPEAWKRTVEVALWLREMTDELKMETFLKSSGKTGLHLFAPVKREFDYDAVREMAETIGRHLEKAHPKEVTMVWAVKNRPRAVFFDHNQNVRGKTLASAYSPRASSGATVSAPLTWDELPSTDPTQFNLATVPERLAALGDPWVKL